ncbi:MAG: hypothetical protein IJW32_01300 [Clostridia bacterium]|nr:hypothetical protein [Clostridia bacterium]
MTKKRSIIKLCIVAVLTLIGLFLTFFSFVIPTTNTTFKGFFNAINYGYDVNGGVLAVYEPVDDSITGYDLENRLSTTAKKLSNTLSGWGFNVTKQNNGIRIEVSETNYKEINNKMSEYGVDILSIIGTEKGIMFSDKSAYDEAVESDYVDGSFLENCTYTYNQQWVVQINFTEEGKTKFKDLTQKIVNAGGKLYMFVGEQNYNSEGFELDSAVSSLYLTATNQQAAEALSVQISVLAKPLNLVQVVNDTISGGLDTATGCFFGNQSALLITGLVVLFVATIVLLSVRYHIFGAFAGWAIAIFTVIYAFLLQSIPLVLMDMNGVVGVLLTYAILVGNMVSIFEKIRSEYASGKKIPNSIQSGFKKNVLPVLERYIFLLIVCAVMFIVGSTALKAIAVNVFVGLFVNYFTLFVSLRGLCALYLPLNATNKKLYNLKRGGDVKHEI